ncbi:NAD-dependent epimerase/dehydratase family protein [Microbacterium gorillae]|uniref:NAD-dependent epimerase/dehydratase family protein n=1 Tax=Microbacterium gorillae TaxID=1231063 RepID=UPI00058DB158|nr:NAD-dependent epimerase/dehydratase family protein [Microbacterium gorillae]
MKILILGGGHFAGPALVTAALARGAEVTVLNRGESAAPPPGVEHLIADRTDPAAMRAAVRGRSWDLAVDTWSGAPRIAADSASALTEAVGRFAYVSTSSVYVWGEHTDEHSPVVDADAEADATEYPADKRGAELGILQSFPDALLVRPGVILGPGEDVGRLPWWLTRIAAGGRFVAPGDPARPLQFIDVRDLAEFTLHALTTGLRGPYDVTAPPRSVTMGSFLADCIAVTGADATPVWIPEAALEAAGVQPWIELPCWVPDTAEFAGFLEHDPAHATAAGLRTRPAAATIAATWDWLGRAGTPPQRPDRPPHGLPPGKERALLAAATRE